MNDKIDFKNFNLKISKFPTLHFEEVNSISIGEDGVSRVIEADSIVRYDMVDDIFGLKVKIIKDGETRRLKANKAYYYKMKNADGNATSKEILFEGNIVYVIDKNRTLQSEKMRYNFEEDLITCESLFTLTGGQSMISGNYFEYNVSEKIYSAKNIRSEIYLEE